MSIVIDPLQTAAATTAPDTPSLPNPNTGFTAGTPREFLSFRLGDEEYGIDILRVQEIRSYEKPTRIANSRHFIKGVVNLRGVIVPLVDLRLIVGCGSAECDVSTVVIVLNVHGRVIGAVVDSVSDVLEIGAEHIKPAPPLGTSMQAGHIMGIGCIKNGDAERMLILTDIEALMSSHDMGSMDKALH